LLAVVSTTSGLSLFVGAMMTVSRVSKSLPAAYKGES